MGIDLRFFGSRSMVSHCFGIIAVRLQTENRYFGTVVFDSTTVVKPNKKAVLFSIVPQQDKFPNGRSCRFDDAVPRGAHDALPRSDASSNCNRCAQAPNVKFPP